ncbi:MAG: hypothetical protein B6229_00315 [Spirochaetaceae bacterium 4572_7]|nr:MAG: hypothetical protein B6229_00315 [Spirochaetaceae bacterium 4572_7]
MFNVLTGLAMGIVVFAITIGVGVVVLGKFGDSVGGDANTTVQALITDLGTGGLAGWTAAIIALAVGLLFIGALMGKNKY